MTNKIGISLGNVCNSAMWGVQNGIRQTKENGYNTCVFDLMISNYDGVVKCINEDFNNFCNHHYLVLTDAGIYNTYYNFEFNHESPDHANLYVVENWPGGKMHFVDNNFFEFKKRYRQRIHNFINYLMDKNNYIVFIFQFFYDTNKNDDFIELRQALSLKYPHLKYEIVVI
jgi:hypothetical protein